MLSVSLIDRLESSGDHERMIEALSRNGLLMPLPLRISLSQSPAAAWALALRRLVEITYDASGLSERLEARLGEWVTPSGVLDAQGRVCALATACVLSAFDRVEKDYPSADLSRRVGSDALRYSLACQQDGDGLFTASGDRTDADRCLTSAFMLYLLAGSPMFTASIRLTDLMAGLSPEGWCAPGPVADLVAMAQLALDAAMSAPHAAAAQAKRHSESGLNTSMPSAPVTTAKNDHLVLA